MATVTASGLDHPREELFFGPIRRDATAPIIGATASRHLDDAIAALTIELTTAEKTALEQPYLARLTID
jgi:hypothetical protein